MKSQNNTPSPLEYFQPNQAIEMHGVSLPHWQQEDVIYFLTWRLADSIPKAILERIVKQSENGIDDNAIGRERFLQIEKYLDRGEGRCLLKRLENRVILKELFDAGNGKAYQLHGYVIMPNHVHLLMRLKNENASVVSCIKGWKGRSSNKLNASNGLSGRVWQRGYWDRIVRDYSHWQRCLRYIRMNPIKARLSKEYYTLWLNERYYSADD